MNKQIEEINKKFTIDFKEESNGIYKYYLPSGNWITIDIKNNYINSKNWYGGYNKNGPWDNQPRNEQGLEGLIHNLISINNDNKDNWKPPY